MTAEVRSGRGFSTQGSKVVPGLYPRECELCYPRLEFHDQAQFARHLRVVHSTKEGGSYICRYGNNNVCQKLPLEGVSDDDYEAHVRRVHCVPLQQSRLSVEDPHEKEFTLTRCVSGSVSQEYKNGKVKFMSFAKRHPKTKLLYIHNHE
ncbi:hypothetical protein Aduo_015429 [Ancylostoma duodenale]